jgi:hypothetical protein
MESSRPREPSDEPKRKRRVGFGMMVAFPAPFPLGYRCRSVVEISLNTNPYQSPCISSATPHSPPSEGSASRRSNRAGLRFVLVTLVSACIGFVFWCVLDFLTVRVLPYPDHVRDFDWLSVAFPVVPFVVAAVALKPESYARRFWLSLASTVLACLLALLQIVTLGIPFHLSIGGQF